MKNWLLILILNLITVTIVQAVERFAVVDTNILFKELAQKTGISEKLEDEFKTRANELYGIEGELNNKIQYLQRDGSTMKASERNKLENDVLSQRKNFSQKAQAFEQDHQRRSNEERVKLINIINSAVKKIAQDNHIDLIIDTNAVVFNSNDVKDITADVLKRLNK